MTLPCFSASPEKPKDTPGDPFRDHVSVNCKMGGAERQTHPPRFLSSYLTENSQKIPFRAAHALRFPDSCAFLCPWLRPRPEATWT